MFQMSAQYGDPKSTKVVRPFHKALNNLFVEIMVRRYFKSVETFSIVLRVCGGIWSFDGEGPQKLQFLKKNKEITIDIVIPEVRWKGVDQTELRKYLFEQVVKSFDQLVQWAQNAGEIENMTALEEDFSRVMDDFCRSNI